MREVEEEERQWQLGSRSQKSRWLQMEFALRGGTEEAP